MLCEMMHWNYWNKNFILTSKYAYKLLKNIVLNMICSERSKL